MTRTCVADEQLGQIARRQHDLFRRVQEGTLGVRVVLDGLQRLIESSAAHPNAVPATPALPTTMTVGGRTYDLVVFHREGEDFVSGDTMVARVTELEAESGEEDARFILEHLSEIPASLRGRIAMVFPKWRSPGDTQDVAYLSWDGNTWYQDWNWLDGQWNDDDRLVRRRAV